MRQSDGTCSVYTGNLKQLFSLDAWDFHASLIGTHGRVVRLWGLFGVSRVLRVVQTLSELTPSLYLS